MGWITTRSVTNFHWIGTNPGLRSWEWYQFRLSTNNGVFSNHCNKIVSGRMYVTCWLHTSERSRVVRLLATAYCAVRNQTGVGCVDVYEILSKAVGHWQFLPLHPHRRSLHQNHRHSAATSGWRKDSAELDHPGTSAQSDGAYKLLYSVFF